MLDLNTIKNRIAPVAAKYGVKRLEVFGSYANGTARMDSDVDLLVEFPESVPSIFVVMGFREESGACLGVPVDVVTLPLQRPDVMDIPKTEVIV